MVRSPAGAQDVAGSADQADQSEPVSVLVSGLGAAPGIGTGAVRILRDPSEGKLLEAGEVLVAPMTTPDWVPIMRRAAALVTDGGGRTCHAAIVSREMGLPAVVGARRATELLRDGELVTVDGTLGVVTTPRSATSATTDRTVAAVPTHPRSRRRRPRRPSARSCTSTSPSPSGPGRRRPCRSTGSGCCEPSSCSPRHSTACIPTSSSPTAARTTSSRRWRHRCSRSRPPSRRDR